MLNELLGVSVACGILYEVSEGAFVAELIQDVNIDLLKQTMDAVNSNPLHHNQSEWHCNTSHCFFGFAEMVSLRLSPVSVFPGDKASTYENVADLLRLNKSQASYLSSSSRTLQELNKIVKAWTTADYTSCSSVVVALSPFVLPIKICLELAKDEDSDVRRAIAERADLMTTMPKVGLELAKDDHWAVRRAIARRADLMTTMPEVGLELAKDKDSDVRRAIAERADLMTTMPEVGLELAKDEDSDVRMAIAERADLMTTMPEVGRELAKDEDSHVRREIAERADLMTTMPEVAHELAKDDHWAVRREIARRADLMTTMPEVGRELAKDEDPDVRMAIAERADFDHA